MIHNGHSNYNDVFCRQEGECVFFDLVRKIFIQFDKKHCVLS